MYEYVKSGDQTALKPLISAEQTIEILEMVLSQHLAIIECNQRLVECLSGGLHHDGLVTKKPAAGP